MIEKSMDSELASLYLAHGLTVTSPKGNSRWGETMVCAEHDSVPYCMDAYGNEEKDPETHKRDVLHGVTHRAMMIERHHAKIKAVYEYCRDLGVGDIWVLAGGGCQLQAFFGNQSGYLAILYLDLEDAPKSSTLEDYLSACGNGVFTLQVNGAGNDKLFEGRFKLDGVELRTHRTVYGTDD